MEEKQKNVKKTKIDMHKYYPDKYNTHTYCEVPIEVASLLEEERKKENRLFSKYKYHVRYTLDLNDAISRKLLVSNITPDYLLIQEYDNFNYLKNIEIQNNNTYKILQLLDELNPIAKKRFLAYALYNKKIVDIAREEKVNHSSISRSISHTKKYLQKNLDSNLYKYRLLHMGIIIINEECKKRKI